jgi:hypothetical protein
MRSPFNRFTGPDWRQVSLRKAIYALEDAVITLSGPALAVSGIIAGVDLLTGGTMLKDVGWLSMAWAVCLLLTLDFQVLALGARAHRIYLSDKGRWRKAGEIAIAFLMAAGISSISIQMQSIIAIMNSETRASIASAADQLGINLIGLTWERSALVLVLIFLSGWFRESEQKQKASTVERVNAANGANAYPNTDTTREAITQLTQQVQQLVVSVTQITTTVTEVKTSVRQITQGRGEQQALPARARAREHPEIVDAGVSTFCTGDEQSVQREQGEQPVPRANRQGEQHEADANTGERIRAIVASDPTLSDREVAARVGCSPSTANKWKRRLQHASEGE